MNLGYHFDLIREAMLAMAEENGSAQFSSDAVDLALLGNSYNDIFQVNERECWSTMPFSTWPRSWWRTRITTACHPDGTMMPTPGSWCRIP